MKFVTPVDAVTVVLAAVFVAWLYGVFWVGSGEAAAAVIAAPGQQSRIVPLQGSGELVIHGAIGASTIAWDERGIRFLRSPCTAQHCVHTGWLDRAGQVAACLPNGITIELRNETERYDGIAF